jgi:hypothetical protein
LDHQIWAAKFFFCEILNFVNVILQVFFWLSGFRAEVRNKESLMRLYSVR